jgi:hypothetical protein
MTIRLPLHWLDNSAPLVPAGVSWGIPWARGTVSADITDFHLAGAEGANVPVQTWPLAYWPDGSVKWTGHAASIPSEMQTGTLIIESGLADAPVPSLQVTDHSDFIEVLNGESVCRISRSGSALIASFAVGGRVIGTDGRLICVREVRTEEAEGRTVREERFVSQVDSAVVEQIGAVRAVVKITGRHRSLSTQRLWLPFTVRFYFFAGVASVRMVHSFVFDGDPEQDFIRSLGVRFSVPLRQQFQNRHVRLAGEETGLFAEPVKVIAGRRNHAPELYVRQIAGEPIPNIEDLPGRRDVEPMAVWDAFRLTQISADSFSIQKRTGERSAWIYAAGGQRSLGLAYVGDTDGGLAVGMRNFWQLHPTGLEVEKASTDAAELTVWLWSPDSPAMDLRHYSTGDHGLDASYEDIEPGFSTPYGIARTTELTLCPFDRTPPNEDLLALARENAHPARLVCAPEHYHSVRAFGVWSLPDRSHPGKKWIEEQLDDAVTFYQGQIEQRRWYGFWDFGDVMHSYDPTRHTWRYDIGGFAWANTELMPDLWLWYSFLRTGRSDIFRLAEAMTRHTQEVDSYHTGRFVGLGSRHNVRHWGCSAKEARISQALLKRFYYYLTTDERTGDLMNEVIDADYTLVDVDPLRKIEPKTPYPTHARVGPDWFALCSNWLAAWERTGDTRYRDKILTGMRCMARMPHKLFSGFSYGYNPATGELFQLHDNVEVPHLAALMGGPELCLELTPLVGSPEWSEAWLHYCRYLQAPAAEQERVLGSAVNNGRGPHFARMTAYAAHVTGDSTLAARAWQEFLRTGSDTARRRLFAPNRLTTPGVPVPVDEAAHVSTNDTAQWSLNAIQLLALVGDEIPENAAPWSEPEKEIL